VELYYPADDQVSGDAELQRWIHDIFTKGFLGNISSGMCRVPRYGKITIMKSKYQNYTSTASKHH